MYNFVAIYYNARMVQGAVVSVPVAPAHANSSLRPVLLERMEKTYQRIEFETKGDFKTALTTMFEVLTKDVDGSIFLTLTGHGPFVPGSSCTKISEYARGVGSDIDLKELFRPFLESRSGASIDQFEVITDAVSVAKAGYWARYTGREKSRSYTVASLIVGTGVGGALVQKYGNHIGTGHHSEFGHTRVHIDAKDPAPISVCKLHEGCLQGVCSWGAILARANEMGMQLDELLDESNHNHPLWSFQAKYLAQGCQNFMFTAPPAEIVLVGSLFDLAPKNLIPNIIEEIRSETGDQFLYNKAELDAFLVHRSLSQEALVGALHHSVSILQNDSAHMLQGAER
ncbi:MAG: ROK family protein [Pseudomonadota bacterium]